jgi:hypothetical protein
VREFLKARQSLNAGRLTLRGWRLAATVIARTSRLCPVARSRGEPGADQQGEHANSDLDTRWNRAALSDARYIQHEHDHDADDETRTEAADVIGDQPAHRVLPHR